MVVFGSILLVGELSPPQEYEKRHISKTFTIRRILLIEFNLLPYLSTILVLQGTDPE